LRRSKPALRKPEKRLRVNRAIRAREVRVVTEEGEQLGVLSVEDAVREAELRGSDLIEVAPQADPPVCRIMDYGKFRFQQRKKERDSQKKSRQVEIKTIRVRPNTDDHDLDVKAKHAEKFLVKGHKVKFNVIFRGPELRHKEIGRTQLLHFIEACKAFADVDQSPRMEVRNMTMILTPRPEILEQLQSAKKTATESSDQDAKGEGEDEEGRGEAVQDHGDGQGPVQEGGAEPSPVEEDEQAEAESAPVG
jgi:translation initiation factor IF-3